MWGGGLINGQWGPDALAVMVNTQHLALSSGKIDLTFYTLTSIPYRSFYIDSLVTPALNLSILRNSMAIRN